eukprot:Polyplicarium_translucidae@DN3749_c0_g1_i1.p1
MIPVLVEVVTTYGYGMSKIKAVRKKRPVTIYVPKFVEVAVPQETMLPHVREVALQMQALVASVGVQPDVSLCEIEKTAMRLKDADFPKNLNSAPFAETLRQSWIAKTVPIIPPHPCLAPGSYTRGSPPAAAVPRPLAVGAAQPGPHGQLAGRQ